MNGSEKPVTKPGIILIEDFTGWSLLFDPVTMSMVKLSPMGVATWKLLNGKRNLQDIVALLRLDFAEVTATAYEEVAIFIEALLRGGMVLNGVESPEPTLPKFFAVHEKKRKRHKKKHSLTRTPPPTPERSQEGVQTNTTKKAGTHSVKDISSDNENNSVLLTLADESKWNIVAMNEHARRIVTRFAEVMHLSSRTSAVSSPVGMTRYEDSNHGRLRRILVTVDGDDTPRGGIHDPICVLRRVEDEKRISGQFLWLAAFIGRRIHAQDRILLHGALVASPSRSGVLMAGPAGVGKTTASRRIPSPWQSLSDDATMVVRDDRGVYWAHPWPTWSRFSDNGNGGRWDVRRAIPLQAVFFLVQDSQERVEHIRVDKAVSLLLDSAKQISGFMTKDMNLEQVSDFNRATFEGACSLAQAIPAYHLNLSLTGSFWREMEKVLDGYDSVERFSMATEPHRAKP